MRALELFTICLAALVSLIKCRTLKHDTCKWREDSTKRCLPDLSGYARYKCQCHETIYAYNCECVNPRKPPTFPSIGILRWNGSWDDGMRYLSDETTSLQGEVHKNSNGHYLMKKKKILKWLDMGNAVLTVEFEIIIPNDDGKTFTRYTGNEGSKICEKRKVDNEGTLTSIWYPRTMQGREFALHSETEKTGTVSTQVWKVREYADDFGKGWEWTVEYDYKRKYAIPTKFYHEYITHYALYIDEYKERLNYFYEPLSEQDESFHLKDYCSNAK